MYYKLAFATLTVIIGGEFVFAQYIPSTTTAAELWNPWTWFWPYAKASAEAYRDYFEKAQKATNELYQQIYKTNAFPWITGNWNITQPNQEENNGKNNQTGNSTQPNQEENNEQTNQENSTQQNQENSNNEENSTQPNEKGDDQAEEKAEENSTTDETTSGAQIQGSVQDDGTADAEANAKVKRKK